jgi:flagellar biogenesis protein FliO
MAICKNRIFAFLTVVVLGGITISICQAQPAKDAATTPLFDKSTSLFANDPNFRAESGENPSTQELFYKMMLAVLLVVILGLAAIYISKKLMPRITSLSGKKIQICETVRLGPHKAIHLIKTGEQTFLIGSTSESITKIAEITDSSGQTNLSPTKDIRQEL